MKLLKLIPSFKPVEIVLLVLFILFLVMPMPMPRMVANAICSPLGMAGLLLAALYLFFSVHPVVAVLFVFVAYELMNRSSEEKEKMKIADPTPTQRVKDAKMKKMNPPKKTTLEEEVVDKMAPIGHSDMSVYTASTFKPVAEDVGSASLV